MPFPLLKQNPVKPGWFGADLRQLPQALDWERDTWVASRGESHLHHSHHSWEHLDHGDLLSHHLSIFMELKAPGMGVEVLLMGFVGWLGLENGEHI